MEISAGDMRMLDLGVANDVTGNIDGEEIDREPKDVEERSEATSGYDGREPSGRFQSPGGTSLQVVTGPSVGSTLETSKDDASHQVPEVQFKKGNAETTAAHPTAATNRALDSGDVVEEGKKNEAIVLDIPDPTVAEAVTKKPEGATKEEAVIGRWNDAMDAEDTAETAF